MHTACSCASTQDLTKHRLSRFHLCYSPHAPLSHIDFSLFFLVPAAFLYIIHQVDRPWDTHARKTEPCLPTLSLLPRHGIRTTEPFGYFWKNVIDETVALELRNMAVTFVCQHWDSFNNVLSVALSHGSIVVQSAQQYADYMNTSRVYGGEAEIVAICQILPATITIHFLERPHASPRDFTAEMDLLNHVQIHSTLDLHTDVTSPSHYPLTEKHVQTHFTPEFQCNVCSKTFTLQKYLNAHLKTHSTERMMQCEHCQECFKTIRTLKKHLQTHSTHTFNCTICNEDFTAEMDLLNHVQIHSTQTFVCNICNKQFHAHRYLTNHFKTHSLTKSFQCQHCTKSFQASFLLNKHTKTHCHDTFFECVHCKSSFKNSHLLANHIAFKFPLANSSSNTLSTHMSEQKARVYITYGPMVPRMI
uniref:C2H2-type domain-containing protein n=1 Tax=Erpetoichthys calabaricus TaxID=27687 RepID=A0A8C4RGI6_ERPCA